MKKLFAISILFLSMGIFTAHAQDTDISSMDNVIYIENVSAKIGSEVTLSVKMKNTASITGFQFDLYLPDGITIAKDEDGFERIELSTARTTARRTDTFSCAERSDGAMRVFCSSTNNYAFSGNDGEVATIVVNIDASLAAGNYMAQIKNIRLSDVNVQKYVVDEVVFSFSLSVDTSSNVLILGCDTNGSVTVKNTTVTGNVKSVAVPTASTTSFTFTPNNHATLEIVKLNNVDITNRVTNNSLSITIPRNSYMFVGFKDTSGSMDVNGDGEINIGDVVSLVNYILNN
ncbi:MAG: hypothetical protein II947_00345 [Bacteroidaceae bacterium]|nr:hypothetical protein [Bacteroidaceae bacterium]